MKTVIWLIFFVLIVSGCSSGDAPQALDAAVLVIPSGEGNWWCNRIDSENRIAYECRDGYYSGDFTGTVHLGDNDTWVELDQ